MNTVLELRQYKIVPGRRDDMIDVFERWFVESQEELGMRLVGQFRDRDDPNRFTWIRSFADMEARERGLNAFYFGPVWQAHRAEANPLLLDNDNVLLLKPLTPELAFADTDRREPPEPASPVVATIFYLWKDPAEGFGQLFAERVAAAGLSALGVYVPEQAKTPSRACRCGSTRRCSYGSRGRITSLGWLPIPTSSTPRSVRPRFYVWTRRPGRACARRLPPPAPASGSPYSLRRRGRRR